MNPMQQVKVQKVTLNIGVGEGGAKLENAKSLLERISKGKPVITIARDRNPTFKLRKGDPIGTKITLRGTSADEVLKKAFETVDNIIQLRNFDRTGNVAFGVKEYIDYPGLKYDPKIGMMGFDVCVTLCKPGARVAARRVARSKANKTQRVSKEEAMKFITEKYKVKIVEPEAE